MVDKVEKSLQIHLYPRKMSSENISYFVQISGVFVLKEQHNIFFVLPWDLSR